ncbi:MerR family transcriptional regulator [Agreia sp.]|uniref:MerR family transcriptional regulator n=1 Tax=Agreia sp. TaxID=1872416 RepID=UPI0035BC3F34
MDWSIQQIAKLAGTTSRTLRHYGDMGLLEPSRIAPNGYRHYDEQALVRLQRILLLRELGLGLPAIASILENQPDASIALRAHLDWLRQERRRIDQQLAAVETTIRRMTGKEELMAEEMFTGFAHVRHEDEVSTRWGAAAFASGDEWWRAKSADERAAFQDAQARVAADFGAAAQAGLSAGSDEAQVIARRHVDLLAEVPGTPGYPDGPTLEYLRGLGELYVSDDRFGAVYDAHGAGTAEFVRAALVEFAGRIAG